MDLIELSAGVLVTSTQPEMRASLALIRLLSGSLIGVVLYLEHFLSLVD